MHSEISDLPAVHMIRVDWWMADLRLEISLFCDQSVKALLWKYLTKDEKGLFRQFKRYNLACWSRSPAETSLHELNCSPHPDILLYSLDHQKPYLLQLRLPRLGGGFNWGCIRHPEIRTHTQSSWIRVCCRCSILLSPPDDDAENDQRVLTCLFSIIATYSH